MPSTIYFIEMMGVPGSYDASVYNHFEDKDQEGLWFTKRYSKIKNVRIATRNVCVGDPMPDPSEGDGFVLAGSYNSVHDQTEWQKRVLSWLATARAQRVPLLGICGSHQLLGIFFGVDVIPVSDGPCIGTIPVSLTESGRSSPLMRSIKASPRFHFANYEHVAALPKGTTLLAHTGQVPVSALDFGDHWYSTQFHPEASAESLGTIWRNKNPDYCERYDDNDAGDQLVENFFEIVKRKIR
jgi:GMP synthase (glutamine-hydrolysing)